MGWGALMGLGNGLQQVGGMLEDKSKREMAEKLQQDREARAADRELAKEERAVARQKKAVAVERLNENTGMIDYLNSDRELIRSEQATPQQLETAKLAREKDAAQVERLIAQASLDKARAEGEPLKQSLAARLTEAKIGTETARQGSLGRSNRDSGGSGGGSTEAQTGAVVTKLVRDYNSLVNSYTRAPKDGEAALTQAQVYDIAQQAIEEAAINEEDHGEVFRKMLSEAAANKASPIEEGRARKSNTRRSN